MPAPEDDRSLSVEEIKAAAGNGQLPALGEKLARQRSWLALVSLFEQVSALPVAVPLLTETVRRCLLALRATPERRRDRPGSADERRTVRLLAGETLAAFVPRPALTEIDRAALRVAAGALADAGDLHRAASTFEHVRDWSAAAEIWGRLGELDEMEACLSREEDRRQTHRAAIGAVRDIEALAAAGERVAALRLAETIPEGLAESVLAQHMVLGLGARLVRARSVTLRLGGDQSPRAFRFAATPAVLGRDPLAEVSLRDPGVSRRHALIAVVGDRPSLTDAGSRSGTFVGGARLLAALPLRGDGEITLGSSCRLELSLPGPGRILLRGVSGLDRGLLAVVGTGPLPLDDLIPEVRGTWLEFDRSAVSLCHPSELPIRLGGKLLSARIDLLHGDRLEIGDAAVALEVL
jgi:FHA domain